MNDTNKAIVNFRKEITSVKKKYFHSEESFARRVIQQRDENDSMNLQAINRGLAYTVGQVLPGFLANSTAWVEKQRILDASYQIYREEFRTYNLQLENFLGNLGRKYGELFGNLNRELQIKDDETKKLQDLVQSLKDSSERAEKDFSEYQEESARKLSERNSDYEKKLKKLKTSISEQEEIIHILKTEKEALQARFNNAQKEIRKFIEAKENIWKKNHRIKSMDSYNLKELQEAYRNLEKTLLELEEQKLTIQTAYNLMVQQNKALESSLSVSRLENMRYEKELKNLEECYESRIEGIRLEYQNEIYNLNFKQGRVRDKQDIKITELENKISALETEKVFGYNELGRITNERNDFEVNYTNLLNEKIENERSLKEKIAILKEQLSSARKDGFIQSLASSSQGIFTACLPSAISCRVNNFIQVYSATKMIGLAPASSGYIFVGIIFVSIWEIAKRLWQKIISSKENLQEK